MLQNGALEGTSLQQLLLPEAARNTVNQLCKRPSRDAGVVDGVCRGEALAAPSSSRTQGVGRPKCPSAQWHHL